MFNITDAIAMIRDADTITGSSILTLTEKGQLLAQLRANVPAAFNRSYLQTLADSFDRLLRTYPANGQTQGLKDSTPVPPRSGESAKASPAWKAERLKEQGQGYTELVVGGVSGGVTAQASGTVTQAVNSSPARKHKAA